VNRIWTPPDRDDWGVVQDVEPSTRMRQLPDGRLMGESRLTLSPEAMEEMWQGYRCARCLEQKMIVPLGAYPEHCPCCGFPMRELQRRQLELDFVGQQPESPLGFDLERELDYLEREHYVKKGSVTPGREI